MLLLLDLALQYVLAAKTRAFKSIAYPEKAGKVREGDSLHRNGRRSCSAEREGLAGAMRQCYSLRESYRYVVI